MASVIGERIRALRERYLETQGDTADAIGVTKQLISNIERGYTQPKIDVLVKLTDHFDTTSDYILGISNDLQKKTGYTIDTDEERIFLSGYRKLRPADRRLMTDTMMRLLDGNAERRLA